MKVTNLKSPRSGRAVANQFQILENGELFFKSYDSIIVKICQDASVVLDETYWDYSRTTSKYRNLWLNEDTATIKNKVKQGIYKLQNLN
jgi:hypothetical protein